MQLGLGQWQGTQKDGRSSHMAKLTECSKGLVMGNQGQKRMSSGHLGFRHEVDTGILKTVDFVLVTSFVVARMRSNDKPHSRPV